MTSETLERLERSAYRSVVDHGFFDLLLAVVVAIFALTVAVWPWFILALFALVLAKRSLLATFNRHLVEPRVGHVRLGSVRLNQISTARKSAALAIFGLGLIVARLDEIGATSAIGPMLWLGDHKQVQIGIIAGVGIGVIGWLFQLPRFLAYALVVLCMPVAASLGGLPAGTGWAIATLIVAVAAGTILLRFVHNNPVAS
ncbi:MAG: hypothetical protein LC637_12925 [Xanthomonadaceae bacterium]|nr:hypothetical protein [Xanthomonadaceae bacterium]